MNSASLNTLTITHHPLRDGERDRQRAILERNAALMAHFPDDRRAAYAAMASQTAPAAGVSLSDTHSDEAKGLWLRPSFARADRVILFIHGGGYHLGDATSYSGFAGQIAARTKCLVFSMDYPLAPECLFPAPFLAVVRARNWLAASGYRQVALVGDSAGGGLALASLNEPLIGSRIASVVVFSPWTDLALTGASFSSPETYDPVFQPSVLASLARSYLGGADPRDYRASPIYGIPDQPPPIAIQVGTDELLLDDSREYARRAAKKGNSVTLDVFEGMHHVFQRDAGRLETADVALDLAAEFITRHWQ